MALLNEMTAVYHSFMTRHISRWYRCLSIHTAVDRLVSSFWVDVALVGRKLLIWRNYRGAGVHVVIGHRLTWLDRFIERWMYMYVAVAEWFCNMELSLDPSESRHWYLDSVDKGWPTPCCDLTGKLVAKIRCAVFMIPGVSISIKWGKIMNKSMKRDDNFYPYEVTRYMLCTCAMCNTWK